MSDKWGYATEEAFKVYSDRMKKDFNSKIQNAIEQQDTFISSGMSQDYWRLVDSGSATRQLYPAQESLSSAALREAKDAIKELTETLERIKKDALILHVADKISKDGKHTYVRKGETELRIEACKDLERGDEVLLHPKTMQIVERLGKPPLELSRFAPDRIPNVSWEDIGGLESAKADLREAIELPQLNKEIFKFYGQKPIKGILLSGPPGCGKTMLGKACATSLAKMYGVEESRTGFLYIKGPEILNQYVGATEQTIRDIFFDAYRHKQENGYPAIVFIDEADAILAARGTRNVGIGNTIVPMFLTEMDGLEESGAIVIIATNRADVLDSAIVRDGRIDRKINVVRPNEENARNILYLNLTGKYLCAGDGGKVSQKKLLEQFLDQSIETLYSIDARIPNGPLLRDIVSGAMIANCVNIAISYAIQRDIASGKTSGIRMHDIKAAIERIRVQGAGILHDLGAKYD